LITSFVGLASEYAPYGGKLDARHVGVGIDIMRTWRVSRDLDIVVVAL